MGTVIQKAKLLNIADVIDYEKGASFIFQLTLLRIQFILCRDGRLCVSEGRKVTQSL